MPLRVNRQPVNGAADEDSEAAKLQLLRDAVTQDSTDAATENRRHSPVTPHEPDSLLVEYDEHWRDIDSNTTQSIRAQHWSADGGRRHDGTRPSLAGQDEKPEHGSAYEPDEESDSVTEDGDSAPDHGEELKPYGVVDGSKEAHEKSAGKLRGRAARNAKECIARVRAKDHQALKAHLRAEKPKRKRSAYDDDEIEPPRAKRRNAPSKGKMPASQDRPHGEPDDNEGVGKAADTLQGLSKVSKYALNGAIPTSSQPKVTKNTRKKQLLAQQPHGQDNRRRSTQRRDVEEAGKIFGYGKVECFGDTDYKLKGMKSPLHDWQLTPVAWMVKRENSEFPPYGGILADVPGMGKTVMSLSCVVGNPPDGKDVAEGSGATLVVLPSQLVVDQWEKEIPTHLEAITKDDVYWYRKSRNDLSIAKIAASFKIVLTTYNELMAGLPSKETLNKLMEEHAENPDGYDRTFRGLLGDLFHINWYRVILDEVHEIKNPASRKCFAVHQLRSKHFWGLSGTPLKNRGKELFPYLKLIGVEGVSTEDGFVKDFCGEGDGSERLDALMNLVSYRRTEKDLFLGRKMLDLPEFHPEDQWVDLSKEERIIYDTVGKYYQKSKAGSPVTRQREATSHPFTLEKWLRENVASCVLDEMAKEMRQIEGKRPVVRQMGSRARRRVAPVKSPDSDDEGKKGKQPARPGPELASTSADDHDFIDPFGKSGFGNYFHMASLLEMTSIERQRCGLCKRRDKVDDPVILDTPIFTQCKHVFCRKCFMKRVLKPKLTKCPSDGCDGKAESYEDAKTLSSEEGECDAWDAANNDGGGEGQDAKPKAKRSRKQKSEAAKREKVTKKKIKSKYGADYNGNLPVTDTNNRAYIRISVNTPDGVPCPSAKITCAKDIVLRWQEQGPDDKIIIFVQFVKTAIMTGIMLGLEGIPFVHLTGTMTVREKENAVKDFKGNPEIKVLVASIGCCGQSLNLTCANRVILIDPWWNDATEQQAFGRVFRLGQVKDSHFVRILARDTIDEHIMELQDSKSAEIDRILQDDGHMPKALGDYEVMRAVAPRAWAELRDRLLDEIEGEDAVNEQALMDLQLLPV